ncbi:helix-turn-helix domain-containing protein [Colwellia psychrerythraea]|uniref:Transcriptional regulator with only HTH domain, AraC family n=1 Tax=Colwellia psychrerythraea TaxID=28229 RepID=A0A099KU89_COLPS|nr:AraC family transcriptional regulator [Colwellia psychrerythraea]KGJ93750.1 transcriptional regulator with only HTH domain, AraC family [Colwellia psychrerythraea]
MKTVSEYSQRNILIIPQSLYDMSDIQQLMYDGNSGVFYKDLKQDLVDVEFYTNIPCVVYIESGQETITTSDNKTHELPARTAIFLPQGLNLHSDYVKVTENLKAYLIFFTDDVLTDFISAKKTNELNKGDQPELLKIQCDSLIEVYFSSLQLLKKKICNSPALVRIKLLEFLHLLSLYDERIFQAAFQSSKTSNSPKRNLTRLLNNSDILKLTISDLANLSGRSNSTFTRDFKAIYDIAPKQWLQNKRLDRAYEQLTNTELTVTHVAADLGYENVSHFIKSFKEKYNITPKQLKQSN